MLKSIRVRLTLWYLVVFGALLIVFSAYVYSLVSQDMRRRFDVSLSRSAQAMASYFTEFAERQNVEAGAKETVKELKEGRESTAIYREGQLLASSSDDVVAAIKSTGIKKTLNPDSKPAFATL